jgi:hypothetical protein
MNHFDPVAFMALKSNDRIGDSLSKLYSALKIDLWQPAQTSKFFYQSRGNTSSTRCAAVSTIARELQDGQTPGALHENGMIKSLWQPSQCAHAKPLAKIPHPRNF